jgi:5-methylcytosine-specific restriction endonuclease McrA
MLALKQHGARCQCCGASPATGAVMNVDHIKPRRIYPELALEVTNLQVLCGDCNHGKGNWDMTDWRAKECASDAVNVEADARFKHVAG